MTADDEGFVSLYDMAKGGKMIARKGTDLSLHTGCIERTQGQMLLAGGTSDLITLFEINKEERNRHENAEKISVFKEFSGHSGNVTSLCFMNSEFFISGS